MRKRIIGAIALLVWVFVGVKELIGIAGDIDLVIAAWSNKGHWMWKVLATAVDWAWMLLLPIGLILVLGKSVDDLKSYGRRLLTIFATDTAGDQPITESPNLSRQQPTITDAVGLRDEVKLELKGVPPLDAGRVPILREHQPFGLSVFIRNDGSADLTNVRLRVAACQRFSHVDRKFAVGVMDDVLYDEPKIGGMSHPSSWRWLIRYENGRDQLLVGKTQKIHPPTGEGLWRIYVEVSADGYTPRREAICFKWQSGRDVIFVGDPLPE